MLFECELSSQVLHTAARVFVILPELKTSPQGGILPAAEQKFPVLYLYHGGYDDGSCWVRRTNIERYATEKGLAVVMPSAGNSYYTDAGVGRDYFTFISQELPQLVRGIFPLSDKREENFVAGLSMGGYGAFKMALTFPERFGAAISMSGVLDIVRRACHPAPGDTAVIDFKGIFLQGRTLEGTDDDLFALLKKHSPKELPRLYACCGVDDRFLEDNRRFCALAEEQGIKLDYEEAPGNHEWDFWDRHIRKALDWMLPKADSSL